MLGPDVRRTQTRTIHAVMTFNETMKKSKKQKPVRSLSDSICHTHTETDDQVKHLKRHPT